MASPQLEHGHVRIANEVLEHLVQAGLSGTEWALVMVVVRETWGWRRKVAPIGQSLFARALGRESLARCHIMALRRLCEKNILISVPGEGRNAARWQVNKDWEKWTNPPPTGRESELSTPHSQVGVNPPPTGRVPPHLQVGSTPHSQVGTSKTVKEIHTKKVKAFAKKPRPLDPAVEIFKSVFLSEIGSPYFNGSKGEGDYVQLAGLRRALGIDTRASPPDWEQACQNYCRTPQGKYTLADLSTRYAVFRRSKLNGFNRPPDRQEEETYEAETMRSVERLRKRGIKI